MNLVEESASYEIMAKTYERLCYHCKHYWTITNHGTCNFAGMASKGLILKQLGVKEVVEKKLGLQLSKDKTELTNFKRGFRFLGYHFIGTYKGISDKSLDKLKDNVRNITRRSQGVNLNTIIGRLNPVIRGHVNYFRLGDVQVVYRRLDSWMRMRLRCFKFSRKWRTDNRRLPIRRFRRMGLLSFEQYYLSKCTKV